MSIEAAIHNDYLKQLAEVAASQDAAVIAVAVFGRSVVLLRTGNLPGAEPRWRVTSYRAGDTEFGQGYYYSSEEAARECFTERLTETAMEASA